jgi:hypothetical protein
MPSQKSLVFFIRDIMGSSLNVKYTNSFGQEENREVWTTDMEKNIDLFSYFPRFFEPVHKSFILTQEVIAHFERIRLPSSLGKLIVYNFLLEFL